MFDAKTEFERLRTQTKAIRQRRFSARKSRLDRHRGELTLLLREGASVAELRRWLRTQRIVVAHSTVARWVASRAPSVSDQDNG